MKHILLLTGNPGSGKTTIIRDVLSRIGLKAGGFYTEELRREGARQGFKISSLDGNSATLAHVNIKSPYKVGKYGVDLNSLEQVAVSAIRNAAENCDVVVIDEIGKMELFSDPFRQAVMEAIDSEKPILGTIMLKSHPWADRLKQHPNVELTLVDRANRQRVLDRVATWLTSEKARVTVQHRPS